MHSPEKMKYAKKDTDSAESGSCSPTPDKKHQSLMKLVHDFSGFNAVVTGKWV
jgi:hypothetical protein